MLQVIWTAACSIWAFASVLVIVLAALSGSVQIGPLHLRVETHADCYRNPQLSGVGRTVDARLDIGAGCSAIIDAEYVAGYSEHGIFLVVDGPRYETLTITSGGVRTVGAANARDVFCEQLEWAQAKGNAIALIAGRPEWGNVPCS